VVVDSPDSLMKDMKGYELRTRSRDSGTARLM
jgi:hypothetical protein